jgi:hypothetical protein
MNYEDAFNDGVKIEYEYSWYGDENGIGGVSRSPATSSMVSAHHAYGGGGYGTTTGDDVEDAESAVSRLARKDDDDTDEHYECRQCGERKRIDDYRRSTRLWCDSEECDGITFHDRLKSHPNS